MARFPNGKSKHKQEVELISGICYLAVGHSHPLASRLGASPSGQNLLAPLYFADKLSRGVNLCLCK